MPSTSVIPIEILLVEDSPSDARLTQEALGASKLHNRVHLVEDGEAAVEFLRRSGSYAQAPRPDLILMDLNLPKKSGPEVLAEIKSDADLRPIPVIILTTSEDEGDVQGAYGLNANCYITKPIDIDCFLDQVRAIGDFWFSIVKLPRRS